MNARHHDAVLTKQSLWGGVFLAACLIMLSLALLPFRSFAVTGQEMTPGGTAANDFTISSVKLIDPDDENTPPTAVAYYVPDIASQSFQIEYRFDTQRHDQVG